MNEELGCVTETADECGEAIVAFGMSGPHVIEEFDGEEWREVFEKAGERRSDQ